MWQHETDENSQVRPLTEGMKINTSTVTKVSLSNIKGLDPISIILENYSPGKGKIIIECFGESWSSSWPAMGGMTIEHFFCSCDEHYLAGNLSPGLQCRIDDLDGLAEHARAHIVKERKADELTRDEARALYELTEDLEGIEDLRQVESQMERIFGDEWWYCIPEKENPYYQRLCLIINIVKAGLKQAFPMGEAA